MAEKYHALMQQLHIAAKTDQLEKVAHGAYRLMQLAGFANKELGERLSTTEQLRAKQFWQEAMEVRTISVALKKTVIAVHAVIWSAAHDIPSPGVHELAREYCGLVARACEKDLKTHNAEVVAIGAKRPRFEPKVYQGGRA